MSEVIPFPITARVRQALQRAFALSQRARASRVDVDHLFLVMESQSGSPVRNMVNAAGYNVAEFFAACRGAAHAQVRRDEVPDDDFIGGLGI